MHHEITRRYIVYIIRDLLHDTSRLVPKEIRKIISDRTLSIVQIRVTNPTSLYPNQRLARPRIPEPKSSPTKPAHP